MAKTDLYSLFGYRLVVSPAKEFDSLVDVDHVERTIMVSPAQMTSLIEDREITVDSLWYRNKMGAVVKLAARLAPRRKAVDLPHDFYCRCVGCNANKQRSIRGV